MICLVRKVATASLLALAAFSHASVSVSKIDYKGWSGCWRVSNGVVDLVVAPQIGRIIRFGFSDGPNLLFENPAMAGKITGTVTKEWPNFGGDKLWPAPQSDWNWPPDPVLDHGTLEVRATGDGLVIHGKPSAGLVFERQIHMSAGEPSFRVLNRLTNVGSKPLERSVWEICQVANPDYGLLPRSQSSSMANGWASLIHVAGDEALVSAMPNPETLKIKPDAAAGHKYGSFATSGWVGMVKGQYFLTLTTDPIPGDPYPDGGCAEEIYTAPGPDSYMELELLGPLRRLGPGQSTSTNVVWTASLNKN